ncbi:acyl-coenzyme A synthetase/AMP-(fatty) acid ligase [Roseibium hamelinense]|uniref:Acyl-coenzyme A synthetase/AMP-(Fatty) acid ligase n=1 Tax=Roseibium hamelinense TaxID=150831 RepID=A0A562SPW4_9HYPH|nr:AMP-binding protein [Roseibium hamelinense]MTI44027.1 AMP-dependent synthetase [Roseibium hamelinense]TWI82766.1 acyl-coenzyme A synthetase/AMP-(fatty) acid ligase [Roseibium hamelinense]
MNLARYCLTNAAPDSDAVALEVVGPGGTALEYWTYRAVEDAVLSIASGLRGFGLSQGDRVLLRLGHTVEFPLLFFGAIAGGCVPVPTSEMLTGPEATSILEDSGAALVLHDGRTPLPAHAPAFFGPEEIGQLMNAPKGNYASTDADDPAFLIYTSGTSGTPKGVLHAQRSGAARRPMYRDWCDLRSSDRLLHAGAFNWTYTLGAGLMDPWANGATSVVYSGPRDPHIWPDLLSRTRATLFAAVPSLYRRILKYGHVTQQSFPNLRHGLTAGEVLPASLYREWTSRTGRQLYEALGMSEISTYISSGPSVPVKPGSPGKPQTGRKVAVLTENVSEAGLAPVGEPGLLAVHRSEPGLMLSYWNRPEETAKAFRGDWFLTGDRARIDQDGYVWYEGRGDDLMNAFGYRVAPEEVESVLLDHPAIQEVAVTETKSGTGVSLITAFVVPTNPDGFDNDDVAKYVAAHLAEYKRPKIYHQIPSLPRTSSGKLKRTDLQLFVPP